MCEFEQAKVLRNYCEFSTESLRLKLGPQQADDIVGGDDAGQDARII